MNARTRTLDEIRFLGLAALARELGPVDMIRFLQQDETGRGDYSRERHAWLDDRDVQSIAGEVRRRRGKDKVAETKQP